MSAVFHTLKVLFFYHKVDQKLFKVLPVLFEKT